VTALITPQWRTALQSSGVPLGNACLHHSERDGQWHSVYRRKIVCWSATRMFAAGRGREGDALHIHSDGPIEAPHA
jgi:hypothetical protein